jgi:hypothetical protein
VAAKYDKRRIARLPFRHQNDFTQQAEIKMAQHNLTNTNTKFSAHIAKALTLICLSGTGATYAADPANVSVPNPSASAANAHAARSGMAAKVAPSDSDNRICVKSAIPARAFVVWTTGKIFSKSYFDTMLPTDKDTKGFDGIPRDCACYKNPKVYDDNWNVSFQKKGNVSDLQAKDSEKFDMGSKGQRKSVLVVFDGDQKVTVMPDQGCDFKPITIGGGK